MSDFDPVTIDVMRAEYRPSPSDEDTYYVESREVPKLVANELRRIYADNGDPGLWFLILRAQEIESL